MKTLETDSELIRMVNDQCDGMYVSPDFARKLEIERDEWRAKACDKDGTPWSTISEWWRAKFEAAESQMALEREDNARLREAGDYLAKCVKLAGAQPESMAGLMCQKWDSTKRACRA